MSTSRDPRATIALVASMWHSDIVERGVSSFEETIAREGGGPVDVCHVPGAFEIPLFVKRLALTGRYEAIATIGLVIDGGIYRHEFVATSVVDALMQVQLETDVPVFSGVLTPHHFHEHEEHKDQFGRHFVTKGEELARALIQTGKALSVI